jgi:hypothetical protein
MPGRRICLPAEHIEPDSHLFQLGLSSTQRFFYDKTQQGRQPLRAGDGRAGEHLSQVLPDIGWWRHLSDVRTRRTRRDAPDSSRSLPKGKRKVAR